MNRPETCIIFSFEIHHRREGEEKGHDVRQREKDDREKESKRERERKGT